MRSRVPAKERPEFFTLNPDSPLAQGLVAFYGGRFAGGDKYDDATESIWGGGNHGTLTGFADPGAAWGRDLGRATVAFDGSDDYIALAQQIVFAYRSAFTLSAFVTKTTTADLASIFGGNAAGNAPALRVEVNGSVAVRFTASTTLTAAGVVTLNTPIHLSVTRAATTGAMRCYANGVDVTSGTPADYDVFGIDYIGKTDAGRFWPGRLSDGVLHSRALLIDEISALADPANVLLRVGAADLIRNVRSLWPVGVAGGAKPWLYTRRSQIIGAGAL